MLTWIILGTYMAGFVLAARRITVAADNSEGLKAEDALDRIGNRVIGVICGLFWPALLLGALVTGKLPKSARQLQADLDARDKRIADLERELGITHQS